MSFFINSIVNFFNPHPKITQVKESPQNCAPCLNVPNINLTIANATQAVGRLYDSNGQSLGCGLLVGIDRLLVPVHVLIGLCPSQVRVSFTLNDTLGQPLSSQFYSAMQFHERNTSLDYCILQLDKGWDGCYPGHHIPIPAISTGPYSHDFFLVHPDASGILTASFGKKCDNSYNGGGFCSINETASGSSGGINFDLFGYAFAMHISCSTGLCGRSAQERKAVFLADIFKNSYILSNFHKCTPICPPVQSLCMPTIEYVDPCHILEKHGTLKVESIDWKQIDQIDRAIYNHIYQFFKDIDSPADKLKFYTEIWGAPSTAFALKYPGERKTFLRIDRQKPKADASNFQIQVGEETIATLLISNKLAGYRANQDTKIAEVVNYVTQQFFRLLKFSERNTDKNNKTWAVVATITPKTT